MTEPTRVVPTNPASFPADWLSVPTFCVVCQVHMATNHQPKCPVCLDQERRDEQ